MKRIRLAKRRKAVGLSQERLSEVLGVDTSTVRRWESGDTEPQPWHRPNLAKALRISLEELSVLLASRGEGIMEQVDPSSVGLSPPLAVPSDAMDRRTLVKLGGASMAAGFGVMSDLSLELTRRSLSLATVEEHAAAEADEWQQIIADYGRTYMTVPASELLDMLTLDLQAMQLATASPRSDSAVVELRHCAAWLCALTAMTLGNLGRLLEAHRWWRSARAMAAHSGDANTVAWICGYEVVRGLYDDRPLEDILRLADHAEAVGAASAPELISGKAQVLAMLGRPDEARAALRRVQELFVQLPVSVTSDSQSVLSWGESFVYSYLGDVARAEAAQHAALRLYPTTNRRGPAQIELMRALCLVRSGDTVAGLKHAQATMTGLAQIHQIRPVVDLSWKILDSLPAAGRKSPAANEFRDYLAASSR